jgi:hypothetical protein
VPEALLHVIAGEESTASLAVTVYETKAPPEPAAGVVIVPGTETTGAVVSCTLTVKVFGAELLPE